MGIDGGYVRGMGRDWFEVIAGKSLVSFHRDGAVPDPAGHCFTFVQTVDNTACARLVDTLRQHNPTAAPLRKLAAAIGEFASYISNNVAHIVNYGGRFRAGERTSTGFVESAINQIVDKRFDKRQSTRWTPPAAPTCCCRPHASLIGWLNARSNKRIR